MAKAPENPFKFGNPVEGESYLTRPELENFVSQFLFNRMHVVLIGPRRFGKTSFILNLLKRLDAREYTYLFVDIFNITSHKDFLHQMLRALNAKKGWGSSLKEFLGSLASLRPKLSSQLDPITGQPSLDFSFEMASASPTIIKEAIQDVFSSLAKVGKKVILAIDEFQKITDLNDGGWLEATLRTHMQQLRNTSFIFTGSRRSVIYDMLNNPSRPLYKFCQAIEFPLFGEEFTHWIVSRFAHVGVPCEVAAIEHLRKCVQDTPNYVQMVCFHLVALGYTRINREAVDHALKSVVQHSCYAYQTLLASLTAAQQRALRLAAREGKQLFSKELLAKYEIASGAALASAIKALKEKEILDEEGLGRGRVVFDDPLFALWLREAFDL